jgi:hypothetical protein
MTTDTHCPDENTLARVADGAAGTLAPALEAHLDVCERCRRAIAAAASSHTRPSSFPMNELRPGMRVGRYEIERVAMNSCMCAASPRPKPERSEQFAFCVSLAEALAGERPFEGDSWSELAAARRRSAPASHGCCCRSRFRPGNRARAFGTSFATETRCSRQHCYTATNEQGSHRRVTACLRGEADCLNHQNPVASRLTISSKAELSNDSQFIFRRDPRPDRQLWR